MLKKRFIGLISAFVFLLAISGFANAATLNVKHDITVNIHEDSSYDYDHAFTYNPREYYKSFYYFFIPGSFNDVSITADGKPVTISEITPPRFKGGLFSYKIISPNPEKSSISVRLKATGKLIELNEEGIYKLENVAYPATFNPSTTEVIEIFNYPRSWDAVAYNRDIPSINADKGHNSLVLRSSGLNSFVGVTLVNENVSAGIETIRKGGVTLKVQNHSKLKEAVRIASENLNYVRKLTNGEIFIYVDTRTEEEYGGALPSAFYSLDSASGYIENSLNYVSPEEASATIIHELNHFSNDVNDAGPFPVWLEEGLAENQELKYSSDKYPSYAFKSIPQKWQLEAWYGDGSYFGESRLIELQPIEDYFLYAFVIRHFEEKYGNAALESALLEINRRMKTEKPDFEGFVTEDYQEFYDRIATEVFASRVGGNKEDFFFPEKDLFISDPHAFEEKLSKFYRKDWTAREVMFECLSNGQDPFECEDRVYGSKALIESLRPQAYIAFIEDYGSTSEAIEAGFLEWENSPEKAELDAALEAELEEFYQSEIESTFGIGILTAILAILTLFFPHKGYRKEIKELKQKGIKLKIRAMMGILSSFIAWIIPFMILLMGTTATFRDGRIFSGILIMLIAVFLTPTFQKYLKKQDLPVSGWVRVGLVVLSFVIFIYL